MHGGWSGETRGRELELELEQGWEWTQITKRRGVSTARKQPGDKYAVREMSDEMISPTTARSTRPVELKMRSNRQQSRKLRVNSWQTKEQQRRWRSQ